ncbi:cyclic nucleotide-binding protein [Zhengella mangrovi]|uniref:Cyclic nucleotide-binding protein n=1 Tax=Zhengella mangrovi TaxID=1982044 RepID=A0A2G1QSI9_9HYPH|nr:cyclic nucleotide-binding domain-containing protein [Zhengella mangrovi]PHP68506.1 cyclic nucleotide-binding protein [Zhengella mangrovi]
MALDDDIRLIGSVGFFEGLTTEQLRLLAFGAESLRLSAGRELYREAAAADGAFIIVSGEIDLTTLKGNRLAVLRTVGPGTILSDLALIAPARRATGAVAKTDCELIRIGRTLFRRILTEYPETAVLLQERFARELQELTDQVARLESRFRD